MATDRARVGKLGIGLISRIGFKSYGLRCLRARKEGQAIMLLTPEKIQQAINHAHQERPGVVLPIMEIYHAIARAQHQEGVAWLEKYGHRLADTHFLLIIPIKDWQAFKEGQ